MMRLNDIKSSELLPRFAKNITWLMNAFDDLVKDVAQRSKSIDAPLTMDAIQACTDEELEALYNQYGVATYYPDLSRATRELMLYNMCKIYRYLGTPKAIEILCNYIFDNLPLNVHVLDNLAFDENGDLIDSSLLDTFDVELDPELPVLDEAANARILANIIHFSRNSQSLRYIYYDFIENFDLQIEPIEAGIPAQFWANDAVCEPVVQIYTLSFVNTQLPDIVITMPADEAGQAGTVVTLPTMSGEYESGGKTWTPSAWDIGAFGSSYTITADTIAHLVFDEVVDQYEEIRLYINGKMNAQYGITSSFNGNVNSSYTYDLYTDSGYTTPWKGFDYSHRYEIGSYVNGSWKKRLQSIEEMPDTTTTSGWVFGFILLDTSKLWLITDCTNLVSFTASSIRIRIYRKDQQYYAGYFNTSNVYNNTSMVYNSAYNMNGSPNTGSHGIGYSIDNMPDKNLSGFYGSGGNLVSSRYNNFAWQSGLPLSVIYYNTNDGTLSIRNVLYTLSQPTFYGWTNPDGNSTLTTASKDYLKNKDYTNVLANKAFRYYPIALFKYNGSCADDSSGNYVNSSNLGIDPSYPNYLCFTESYGTISLSRVWYRKEYWGEPVELELWYSSSFSDSTFSANDYWFSYFKTSAMEDTASQFGMAIHSGSSTHQLSRNNIVGFEYEILGLYKADGTQVTADLSNFYVGTRSASQSLLIKNIAAFSTQSAMWKVRVWKYTPYNGYLAENGAQGTTDTTLPSSRTYLRDSIGNAIEWDSTVDYEIKIGLTYDMTVVDIPNDIFIQRYNNYVSVYVPSSLANTITAYRIIYAKHSKNEFWLDGVFGTPTEIPVGFTVDYIMCDRVYLHIDSISYSGNNLSISVNGANEYFSDTDTSLLALGANPYIDIFLFTADNGGNFLTYGASSTPDSYNPSSLSGKKLNSDGKCVEFTATFATAGRAQEYYEENAGTRLIQLRKFDQYNKIVRYYFKIQQSLWQMQGDYIQWLGDTTDPADPANHYNGKAVLIHCVRVQS